MFRSLGRMPWSLVWLVFAVVASRAVVYGETPSRMELRTVHGAASPERAIAKIKLLGARFETSQRVQPLQVDAQPLGIVGLPNDALPTDVPLPDPPPELPPDEILPKNEDSPSEGGDGLIADAFVSPLIAPAGAPVQSVVSITIDSNWRGGDSALELLREVPDLVSLKIRKATLTDAALVQIAGCRQLESLEISGVSFAPQALARFRSQRPDVRISSR